MVENVSFDELVFHRVRLIAVSPSVISECEEQDKDYDPEPIASGHVIILTIR